MCVSACSYLAGFGQGQTQESALALVTTSLALGELLERLHRGGRAEAVGAQVAAVLVVGLLVLADGLCYKQKSIGQRT